MNWSKRIFSGKPGPVCSVLFLLYAGIACLFFRASDQAFFGGDTWEYQSMAVNFVHGHGMRAGGVEPLEVYRFETGEVSPEFLSHFQATGLKDEGYNVYRTPAYPFVIGLLYKIFGVHPVVVYGFQMLLLILVAAALPALGYTFAKQAGIGLGAIAGAVFLISAPALAREMMTESLIVTWLLIVAFAFQYALQRPSAMAAFGLGLLAGGAALVKGSLIFVPVLIGFYFAWRWLRKSTPFRHLPGMALAMAIPILGWSAYASSVHGGFVFLSTQGDKVLLDGNNELGLQDGGWHPEWHSRSQFWVQPDQAAEGLLYNQAGMAERSSWSQVLAFYQIHWKQAPRFMMHKINRAFERSLPFRGLVLLLIWNGVASLFGLWQAPKLHATLLLVGVAIYVLLPKLYVVFAEISFWLLPAICAQIVVWWKRPSAAFRVPVIVNVFVINYFIVTLLTFGFRRFVMPLDPFVLLTLFMAVHSTFVNWMGQGKPRLSGESV